MPSPEARAAYADVRDLGEALRALHDREQAMLARLATAAGPAELLACCGDLQSLDSVRSDLLVQCGDAVQNYVAAVERAERAG